MVGYYLLFTARRMDARPEDRMDAEISEGAGEMGFFAPHSWWPMAAAFAFSIIGMGLIFGTFLLVIGIGVDAVFSGFERGIRRRRGVVVGG